MLDQAFHVRPNSRLGCQLHLTPELDGLVARLAPEA
jgi:2Fe-2S ferredoxin